MATNFLGSSYFETSSGDFNTSTQTPYWAFGTNTSITGWLGPSDPSGLYTNTWQDSIAFDTATNSGTGDPQHPRAFVPGHTYHITITLHNFEHADVKLEQDTAVLKSYALNNYGQYTINLDFTAASASFYNICLNGWGRTSNGSLADVKYTVSVTEVAPPAKPDLTDTANNLGATTLVAGQSIVVNHTLHNQGAADVASQKFAIYLSTDSAITTGDTFLGELTTGQLMAGGSATFSTSTLPLPNLAPGKYFVGVIADHVGAIGESNESNNASNALMLEIAPTNSATGLPTTLGFGSDILPASTGEHSVFKSYDYYFDVAAKIWSVLQNGYTIFKAIAQSAAQEIYDFVADRANEKAIDFADEYAVDHVPGGRISFDAWRITQPAASFYQSTKIFFDKTWTRLDQAFVDADPTNPNLDASFDINAVEADLKAYTKENIDRIIGLPVNASLSFAEKVANGIAALFHHSAIGVTLDIDIDPSHAHVLTGTNGHRNIMAATLNDERILGGDQSDVIYSGAGRDIVLGNKGSDIIIGGDGNDVIYGNDGNDVASGGAGDDTVNGDLGNDRLYGGDGNDIISGGGGVDVMFGGLGNDIYVIDNAGDVVDESVAGSGGNDRVQSSVLSINLSDGFHLRGAVEAAMLTGSADLNLSGNALANTLFGNAGNNLINGGASADFMRGYAGNDIYVIDNAGDVVDESVAASGGNDRVQSSVLSINLSDGFHLRGAVEAAMLTGSANLNLSGNALANTLFGNAGNNLINGGASADFMRGYAGNDIYVIDNAGDVVDESVAASGGNDRVQSSVLSINLSDGFHLRGAVEAAMLTGSANLNLSGNALANTLFGNAGNNLINGGASADFMRGYAGNDIYVIDNAGDVVDESVAASGGNDRVQSSVLSINLSDGFHLRGAVEAAMLTGSANLNLSGNALANTLFGNAGNNLINGGASADFMRGYTGNDIYVIDNAGDVVDESVAGSAGVDSVRSALATNLSDAVHFKGAIENSTLTGAANVGLAGNALANVLTGNAGSNVLNGLAGNDLLNGGVGADLMCGGAGSDVYLIDNAGDVVDESVPGSNGTDRVQSSVLSINLSDTVHVRGAIEAGMLTGSGNLNLIGNALANTLFGNAGNNIINGLAGADNMRGLTGNDTYVVDNFGDVVDESAAGSAGLDTVQSSISTNLLDATHFKGAVERVQLTGAANLGVTGNALANVLVGNAGKNIVNGFTGNDQLIGGAGNDTFFFNTALNAATNVDAITDFSAPADTIRLENAIFTALDATGVLAASAFHVGASATTAAQHILYNAANGWLSYDADGNGAGAAIHFATLNSHPPITNDDFFVV